MNEEFIKILQSGADEEVLKILGDFNKKNAQTFKFPEISKEIKHKCIELILNKLDSKSSNNIYVACLETLRILSRDKSELECLVNDTALKLMLRHAGLEQFTETEGENITIQDGNSVVIVEAQKCLCNVIFNSHIAQRLCSTNGCVDGIVQRLKTYKDPELQHDIKFFDMRILFLVTALVPDVRAKMVHQLHGFTYLIEVLDLILTNAEDEDNRPLVSQEIDLACEVLKILFNLTLAEDKNNLDEEEEAHYMRLVSILHDLLLCDTAQKDKREDLQSHTVNLLVNMPRESYNELLTPMSESPVAGAENKQFEYDGKNMEAVIVILNFLHHRLDHTPKGHVKEGLTPVLHCLCEICRSNRSIRKFCRQQVLPPLRDEVKNLPEEGETLRNKLCKLFTNPVMEVKDLAADFCFVLCKEDVSRFVKYTGYGNAAGLLAQRGLMCGGRGTTTASYSSESDSDTEEYEKYRDLVNPITGRWEQPPPNPMEGMSDEQKEYEAINLMNQIDRLQRFGVIQPSTIGEEGKPRPVQHVLELLENQSGSSNAEGGHESESD